MAYILPINKTMVQKFEKEVGKFRSNSSGRTAEGVYGGAEELSWEGGVLGFPV